MADKKITELTELTIIADEDLAAVVDDPSGVPETKKITRENLLGSAPIKTDTINEKTAGAGVTVDGCLIKDGNVAKATVLSTTAKARAYNSAGQTINNDSVTIVVLDAESYDPGGNFASNGFTVPVSGYYLIVGQLHWTSANDGVRYQSRIYKDATVIAYNYVLAGLTAACAINILVFQYFTDGEVITMRAYQNSGGAENLDGGEFLTWLSVHLIST